MSTRYERRRSSWVYTGGSLHLVKLANGVVTGVRRRVTWDRRGHKVDPEWANRRRLLTARERLRPNALATMWNELVEHDPTGQILAAWIAN
jgi:transposase